MLVLNKLMKKVITKFVSKEKIMFYLAFLIPIFLMTVIFKVLSFYPFGEKTLMSGDYIHQYIPIYRSLGDVIKGLDISSFYWSWSKGLGGSMVSVYAFNGLSPITILLGLVSFENLNIAIFVTTLLRHGLAGWTFYYFLHRRGYSKNDKKLALIVSTIYSMNGFLVSNQINPNFLDNIILLPLLIIGVEKILSGEKSFKYAALLATMIVCHFYTAYMAAMFVIIYAIYYLIKEENLSKKIQNLFRLAGYSLLGVGLSAVFLIPLIYSLLETKVVSGSAELWDFGRLYSPLVLLVRFFVGSSAGGAEWSDIKAGPNFYVSFLALLVIIKFFISKKFNKREFLANIFILLFFAVMFSNTAIQKFMHMGQLPVGFYHRNAWVLSFFFALLIYQVLNKGLDWGRKSIYVGVLAIISYYVIFIATKGYKYEIIGGSQYRFSFVILLLFLILMFIKVNKNIKLYSLLFLVLLDMSVNATTVLNRSLWNEKKDVIEKMASNYRSEHILSQKSDNLSRVEKSFPMTLNESLVINYKGINHFTSSIDVTASKYLGNLGLASSKNIIEYSSPTLLTDAFLNIRYIHDSGYWKYTSFSKMSKLYKNTADDKLLENPYIFGLALSANKSIEGLNIENSKAVNNQNNLMKELFNIKDNIFTLSPGMSLEYENMQADTNKPRLFKRVSADKPAKIVIKFTPTDNNSYYLFAPNLKDYSIHGAKFTLNGKPYSYTSRFNEAQIWNLAVEENGKQQTLTMEIKGDAIVDLTDVNIYKFDNDRFIQEYNKSSITKWFPSKVKSTRLEGNIKQLPGKNYIVTSIPYNKGWSIKIDGKEVESKKVLGAFIGFELDEGEHKLEFSYTHPGLILGAIISIFSLLTLLYLKIFIKASSFSSQSVG